MQTPLYMIWTRATLFFAFDIYIYIDLHRDCFVESQLFSVARHIGHFKLGSKPAQLYVRLSILAI